MFRLKKYYLFLLKNKERSYVPKYVIRVTKILRKKDLLTKLLGTFNSKEVHHFIYLHKMLPIQSSISK